MLVDIFSSNVIFDGNFIEVKDKAFESNQQQTNEVFSEKWSEYEKTDKKINFYDMQKEWYMRLYGFEHEQDLAKFLQTKKYIFDAGCGLGYKAKWFADLSPKSIVIGMDFSDASRIAAKNYKDIKNLYFIKGDIADIPFKDASIDYVSCDQVIMHTQVPENTFKELVRITKSGGGEFACYVYAKKALPRELLDDYFRIETKNLSNEQLWEMSRQLTKLGKRLSELNIEIDIPDIPLLGIKGGKQDIQRFVYWNFLKCFWNEELGYETSVVTNFDWYSPSNAKRYSEEEYKKMIMDSNLSIKYFHKEEACYSGRFVK
ncbi:SAM-dependent methyltransferase [Campylobacter hyointestinalis subsp. lawsonii CCUG 27631]|uniref:class I SAM-dependent methyltransferase n=1 Tax=Campylobacter hyointestinalis TaxID=198 RepID=UPI0007C8D8AB|nr:class I SAM-dependent methyltransferase [Campylobacter hyointestinalis]ANE33464.1 SAM-dependent methyltransferase [Campylobacter hyointestinalis subsp. lawsonii CCUG 27631]